MTTAARLVQNTVCFDFHLIDGEPGGNMCKRVESEAEYRVHPGPERSVLGLNNPVA